MKWVEINIHRPIKCAQQRETWHMCGASERAMEMEREKRRWNNKSTRTSAIKSMNNGQKFRICTLSNSRWFRFISHAHIAVAIAAYLRLSLARCLPTAHFSLRLRDQLYHYHFVLLFFRRAAFPQLHQDSLRSASSLGWMCADGNGDMERSHCSCFHSISTIERQM